ncbi:GNAT family N-acetyltransferase [Paenibacillus ferrarius]|uniref:GNAT family N-acetyltransferase n=1 Tax=Paenibacillus ferrarius TaxID=1469647 RepID=UPI00268BBAD9
MSFFRFVASDYPLPEVNYAEKAADLEGMQVSICKNPPYGLDRYIKKNYIYWLGGSFDATCIDQLTDYVLSIMKMEAAIELWAISYGEEDNQEVVHRNYKADDVDRTVFETFSTRAFCCFTFWDSAVQIVPWAETDFDLLHQLNIPEMLDHLGGPETDEQVHKRHKRYIDLSAAGKGRMFSIVLMPEGVSVGNVGYWETSWQGETVYEMGWGVLPLFQGKGIAAWATAEAIKQAKAEQRLRSIHAFPSVDNPASNAICRKLHFQLVSECSFEYPPGTFMHCNDWRLPIMEQ